MRIVTLYVPNMPPYGVPIMSLYVPIWGPIMSLYVPNMSPYSLVAFPLPCGRSAFVGGAGRSLGFRAKCKVRGVGYDYALICPYMSLICPYMSLICPYMVWGTTMGV